MTPKIALTAALTAALIATATPALAGRTITIGPRQGGHTHAFVEIAKRWHARGVSVQFYGHQTSAAAIQLALFRAMGGKICAARGFWQPPQLRFHLSALPDGRHANTLRHWLPASTVQRIGKLPARPDRFTVISPAALGIPDCKTRKG